MKTGDRFGQWTVLDGAVRPDYRVPARCDCGVERDVYRHKLTAGQTLSCGHTHAEIDSKLAGVPWPDLAPEIAPEAVIGARFGRWTVTGEIQPTVRACDHPKPCSDCPPARKNRTVPVRCDCGNTRDVVVGHLLKGKTKSCGCLKVDAGRALQQAVNASR